MAFRSRAKLKIRKSFKTRRKGNRNPLVDKRQAKPTFSSNEEDSAPDDKDEAIARKSFKEQLGKLSETDPEFHKYLEENDKDLLTFQSDSDKSEEDEREEEESNDLNDCSEAAVDRDAVKITLQTIEGWTKELIDHHSVAALTELTYAFRSGIFTIVEPSLSETDKDNDDLETRKYIVQGETIFNALVLACLRHVCPTLRHHFPSPSSSQKFSLPSNHRKWGQMRLVVKSYLVGVLQLLNGVTDPSMISALLRHVEGLWIYYCCFPKLSRQLSKQLVNVWSQGGSDDGTTVLSFLILQKIFLSFNEHKRESLLKQLYLSYIRNSRYTTPTSLPHIRFMCGCLVEFLCLSPNHAYQLIFIYTRQLANQLRSAFADKAVAVATWPFLHSLELFTSTLSSDRSDKSLSPLIYPVTQVGMGVVQHLSSPVYIPTRLHVVRMLMSVAMETNTYIPLAPVLLEILETQSSHRSYAAGTSGKPPNLMCTLKLRKNQMNDKGTQSAVLNHSMELLIELLAGFSHHISFPEMCFPTVVRMRKMMKTTPLSWFKHHIKQIIDKTEQSSKCLMEDRAKVSFSPRDGEQIDTWERERKLTGSNPLKSFKDTWQQIRLQLEQQEKEKRDENRSDTDEEEEETRGAKRKKKSVSRNHSRTKKTKNTFPGIEEEQEDDEDDILEDLDFSSDDN